MKSMEWKMILAGASAWAAGTVYFFGSSWKVVGKNGSVMLTGA